MAAKGLDPSRRPARLVPVVLPLLSRPPDARRGRTPDRPLESDTPAYRADQAQLSRRRHVLAAAPAPGAATLGLRQPQVLKRANEAKELLSCARDLARRLGAEHRLCHVLDVVDDEHQVAPLVEDRRVDR